MKSNYKRNFWEKFFKKNIPLCNVTKMTVNNIVFSKEKMIEDEKIIGHIFFSPVSVLRGDRITKGMGLSPMAVLPAYHMIPSISVTIKADKIFCIQIRYFEKQLFVPL